MTKLSAEIKRLYEQFDGWISGRVEFSCGDAREFKRDLVLCGARAAMMELGVDTTVIDVAIEASTPGTNVTLLSEHRVQRLFNTSKENGNG